MLEPPTPAGEPFAAHEGEESRTNADFEQVCISLVERGWKIMPKKGTYPINKQGPRYVNLVDPRGNRKSVRVTDENLWEKLRIAESKRSQKRKNLKSQEEGEKSPSGRESDIPRVEVTIQAQISPVADLELSTPSVSNEEPSLQIESSAIMTSSHEIEPAINFEKSSTPQSENAPESTVIVHQNNCTKAEIVDNPPRELQNFALKSPRLQKSIFDLGFETLLTALQSESITPAGIVEKIQEWSMESRNLIEYVHKWQESVQKPMLPDASDKDELIAELQATLKETERKLSELLRSLSEI